MIGASQVVGCHTAWDKDHKGYNRPGEAAVVQGLGCGRVRLKAPPVGSL